MMHPIQQSRSMRAVLLAAAYFALLAASLVVSLLLRFDFRVPAQYWRDLVASALWLLPLKLLLLWASGQFRSLLTFFSLPDARRLAAAMAASAAVAMAVWFAVGGNGIVPRGVILTDMVVSFGTLVALRTTMRLYREKRSAGAPPGIRRKRALIVGAGDSGAALLRELRSKPATGLEVVAFLDDDTAKIGGTLHTAPIMGPLALLPEIAGRLEVQKIIIAMPSAPPGVIRGIVNAAHAAGLDHDVLPSVAQILRGRVTVNHLRPVQPEDLLGRQPVLLDDEGIAAMIGGQTVLVTGAGGSIGAELCRQIAGKDAATLVLLERSEPALFAIHEELRAAFPEVILVPSAADVRDETALDALFATHRPAIVFHAAAHKHVPLMEQQPLEAYRNNVLGTAVLLQAVAAHGTGRFVLISSDKAVNPAGVMGATKHLAEKLTGAFQAAEGGCVHSSVRFGNVLGSSGSVVPVFHRQIAEGGPVTVTDPRASRFFMTIPEAAGLILQSALLSQGGETFLLEMGQPVRIHDLARQMIELAGFLPERDIEIKLTGLRPGEKLHEETVSLQETLSETRHPHIRRVGARGRSGFDAAAALRLHRQLCDNAEEAGRLILDAAGKS